MQLEHGETLLLNAGARKARVLYRRVHNFSNKSLLFVYYYLDPNFQEVGSEIKLSGSATLHMAIGWSFFAWTGIWKYWPSVTSLFRRPENLAAVPCGDLPHCRLSGLHQNFHLLRRNDQWSVRYVKIRREQRSDFRCGSSWFERKKRQLYKSTEKLWLADTARRKATAVLVDRDHLWKLLW